MKSVIAAFTDSAAAHQAALELDSIGIENKNVRVLDTIEEEQISKILQGYDVPPDRVDRYKDLMRRGSALVTVETSDEAAERVASFLDDRGALDLGAPGARDERELGELERGGVRARAFVTERPIREQVELRDDVGDAIFQEEEVLIIAQGEEVVVQKEVRVVERVHIDRDVEAPSERDLDVEPSEPDRPRR